MDADNIVLKYSVLSQSALASAIKKIGDYDGFSIAHATYFAAIINFVIDEAKRYTDLMEKAKQSKDSEAAIKEVHAQFREINIGHLEDTSILEPLKLTPNEVRAIGWMFFEEP